MKLAEAIKEKSRLKKTVAEIREKLEEAAQGNGTDNPVKLLGNLEETLRSMEDLAAAIYRTNDRTLVDGKTLTQLINTRDTLFFRQELYRDLIRRIDEAEDPASSGLRAFHLQEKADRMRRETRSLNDLIQKTNWETELAGQAETGTV